jgi:thymidylate synthase (FAD)
MARVTTQEAEALLDQEFPVLDKGFVRLVDYLGGDARIVQAARVSYGEGTKTVREDRALIDYLMRHAHTSPFEMVELTFHIKAPIFVVRQWFRHRTACLSGDVALHFDEPAALGKGKRKLRKLTLAGFYRKWREGYTHTTSKRKALYLERIDPERAYTVAELAKLVERREEDLRNLVRQGKLQAERVTNNHPKQPSIYIRGCDWHSYAQKRFRLHKSLKSRLAAMNLRMCNEETGEIEHTQVVDIWQSGVKPVFEVTLENGYRIKMTKDHRCLTEQGWLTLEQVTGLRLSKNGNVSWRDDAPGFAVNGLSVYQDRKWLEQRHAEGLSVAEIAERADTSYPTIRKYLRAYGLQFSPAERARLSGQAQRGKRRNTRRGPLSDEALSRIREARSGPRSNFWKGGITPERASIGRWTKEQASRVHARCDYRCVLCGKQRDLHAHHLDPVWHNPALARDVNNLISLCRSCHQDIHRQNLELVLLNWVNHRKKLNDFWPQHSRPYPKNKPKATPIRLVRSYAKVSRIAYVGMEMTYDLEVAGPYHNFVAGGFIVHNSVNEVSARYSVMKDEFYLPAAADLRAQGKANRQVGEGVLPAEVVELAQGKIDEAQKRSYASYQALLEQGIARELAREVLPVGLYTEFYWKQDLHNLFHFLRLRMDWHAQYEIRAYGDAIARIVKAVAPMAYAAFEENVLYGCRLSKSEIDVLRELLDPARLQQALADAGMKRSRQLELLKKLGLIAETA